ncbi:acyl-CoA carboxylase subunit epsilon [Demequina sp.]|uniref:acyl-CoA carboxylase subunit epsilon n=1 Tax=Demequina sp. TaxID=2050685 RepID=UPI003A8A0851
MSEDPFEQAAGMRIVRGAPDDAELAALIAGMVAVASADAGDDSPGAPTSAWMDRSRSMRGRHAPLPLGRGDAAWRHSLR